MAPVNLRAYACRTVPRVPCSARAKLHTCVDAYNLAHKGINVRRSVGVEGRRSGDLMRKGGEPLAIWAPSLSSFVFLLIWPTLVHTTVRTSTPRQLYYASRPADRPIIVDLVELRRHLCVDHRRNHIVDTRHCCGPPPRPSTSIIQRSSKHVTQLWYRPTCSLPYYITS